MSRPLYSFDTSSLVAGADEWLPVEHFPSFWDHMDELARSGRVLIIDEVIEELSKKNSAARAWCDKHRTVQVEISEVIQEARRVAARFGELTKPGRGRADGWVVALAMKRGATVVTDEKPTKSSGNKRPKIPDVCHALNIPVMPMRDLVRAEGWSF